MHTAPPPHPPRRARAGPAASCARGHHRIPVPIHGSSRRGNTTRRARALGVSHSPPAPDPPSGCRSQSGKRRTFQHSSSAEPANGDTILMIRSWWRQGQGWGWPAMAVTDIDAATWCCRLAGWPRSETSTSRASGWVLLDKARIVLVATWQERCACPGACAPFFHGTGRTAGGRRVEPVNVDGGCHSDPPAAKTARGWVVQLAGSRCQDKQIVLPVHAVCQKKR